MAPTRALIALLVGLAATTDGLAVDAVGGWVTISDGIVADLTAQGKQPGYPGGFGGIAVDRMTGDVYVVACEEGLWRSDDHGAHFKRIDGGAVGGRCEYGFSLDVDPDSSRLMCFMIYGGSALISSRGTAHVGSSASHLDFGATDWTDGKTMIAVHHESGGKACISVDGGASWHDIESGFHSVGVFDATTFVARKDGQTGTFRSTDAGATWTKVSELTPNGRAMRCFKGHGYWTSAQGVMCSTDRGATWSIVGSAQPCANGPFFGRDESHLAVVGPSGIMETSDGGATWRQAAPPAPGSSYREDSQFTNYAWDWRNGIFYWSAMGNPAMRYQPQALPEDTAKADKLIAQAEKAVAANAGGALDALLKLDAGTSALVLDAERRDRIATLTHDAHAELLAHEQAVREVVAHAGEPHEDTRAADKIVSESGKSYARTALAAWFADARPVIQAKRALAGLSRQKSPPPSPNAKKDFAAGLDELAKRTATPEFKQELQRLAAEARR